LFLCHRLPWPPDKGDKIRSYRVLRRLAERYRVFLGTFVDDPADWRYLPEVEKVCAGICVRPLQSWRTRWRALASLARGEALTVGIYRDREMRRWVERVMATEKPDLALCFSSGVAPFVLPYDQLRRVMDFVDVDSDKWRQYARAHLGLPRMIYQREARRLANFECEVAAKFDASMFVSESEAVFFRKQVSQAAAKVQGVPNGVDAEYWNPQRDYTNPYRPNERAVVFVGAMDYRPNVHAVEWFAAEVWPWVRSRQPAAHFYIVGSKPAPSVRALGDLDGITVTGRVDDVRPYVAHAHAVAAPLRIARGIQNKVLEALAMEKVVLATPEAWEGIEDFDGRQGCIDGSPEALATAALRWLDTPIPVRVASARAMILRRHDWARNLDAYENVLGKAGSGPVPIDAMRAARLEACS
jgi:sugar transferase (PEP-CTERM/EpsH1 system associated)